MRKATPAEQDRMEWIANHRLTRFVVFLLANFGVAVIIGWASRPNGVVNAVSIVTLVGVGMIVGYFVRWLHESATEHHSSEYE